MPKPKGGRGYAAPYETRQVRIPEPIINQVHELIERYQDYIATNKDASNPPQLLDQKPVDNFEAEVERLKQDKESAVTLLKESLRLKANAGGAIKREIEKVLVLLE